MYFINRRGKSIDELMVYKAAFFRLARKVQMNLSFQKKRELTGAFQYSKGASKKARDGLFTRAYGDRIRGNGLKLKEDRFRLDNVKKLFTVRLWTPCPWKCSRPGCKGL